MQYESISYTSFAAFPNWSILQVMLFCSRFETSNIFFYSRRISKVDFIVIEDGNFFRPTSVIAFFCGVSLNEIILNILTSTSSS
jgi:hypothetical protein